MPGTNFVLLDSDALIGLANSADTNHQKSLLISNFLAQNNFGTIIPYPIVLEAATALSRNTKINRPDLANEILVNYIRTENWLNMDQNVESQVSQSFSKNTSRKNTPFDHYLLALPGRTASNTFSPLTLSTKNRVSLSPKTSSNPNHSSLKTNF